MTNLLSAAQAAEVLGVSGGLVRKWCQIGRLKARRVGWSYVIDRADLDAFAKVPRPNGRPRTLKYSEHE